MTTLATLSRLCDLAELGLISHGDGADAARTNLTLLTRQVAELLNVSASMVTAVLPSAVVVLAGHGVAGLVGQAGGMPVEWSFCDGVCRSGEPIAISDTTTMPVVPNNPLVDLEGLRAYLGVPVRSRRGNVIGSLCVTCFTPRAFTDDDTDLLRHFAAEASEIIESTRRPA